MRRVILLTCVLCVIAPGAFASFTWETIARFGEIPSRDGGEFYYPSGVTIDQANGDVYVTDTLNQQIQRFDANGNFLNKWNFTGGVNLSIDSTSKTIYVGSGGDHKVYKFDQFGNQIAVWGGFGTSPGLFNKPRDTAVHPVSGNVFVMDSGNRRVQEFTPDGEFIQAWTDNALYNPFGIAIDPSGNYIWIANSGSLSNNIRKYDLTGNVLLSFGSVGSEPGDFRWPRDINVDAFGNIFVADTDMERIQKFDQNGNFLQTFMGPHNDEQGPAHPRAVDVNRSTGEIYAVAAYSSRIDKFDASGTYLYSWGNRCWDSYCLNNPLAISVDPVHKMIYIADTLFHRVKKFTYEGGFVGQYGNWPLVHRDDTALAFPGGVTTDAYGNFWALNGAITYADDPEWGSSNYVRRFNSDGGFLFGFSHPSFTEEMTGIAINKQLDEIYVSNRKLSKIMRFDFSGTPLGEWGSQGSGNGQFHMTGGIAVDEGRNVIYVVDTGNNRVQKFDLSGAHLLTFGGSGSGDGQFRFATNSGIAVDINGNVFVADTSNDRIQIFTPNGEFIQSIGTTGLGPGKFRNPIGVAIDGDLLFVLETSAREIEVIRLTPYEPAPLPPPPPPPNPITETDRIWMDDAPPTGASVYGEWNFVSENPWPYSGNLALKASGSGLLQKYFFNAGETLLVEPGDTLFAYVYLDPLDMPQEIMLEWRSGTSWNFRAYWGQNLINYGVDGTSSRRYMGPLPPGGGWVRLEVPASEVGLEGRSLNGMSFTQYGGTVAWDAAGVSPTPPHATYLDTGWFDDSFPAGAIQGGDWVFSNTTPAPVSGDYALQSGVSTDIHQHYFYNATDRLTVDTGDELFAYVYLDPANPPSQIMLQWYQGGSWNHRAYWGENNINWGVDGTASRRYMGNLPATGGWVRLQVPASEVNLEGKLISGMAFTLYGGRATWDYVGKSRLGNLYEPPPPPAPPEATDTVWIDDAVPHDAILGGTWSFIGSDPSAFSGAFSHESVLASGVHQHYFYNTDNRLVVSAGDSLIAYVYLDPTNPPRQIMLQWRSRSSWNHRAYWGENLISWGTDGTDSRRNMGGLPGVGGWVRLEIPAAQVGLEGKEINGVAFTLYDGRAYWDYIGKTQ